MAIYHLSVKVISRGKGDSIVAAAAYRSRSVLDDERTGQRHDYRRAGAVLFSAIYAPKEAPEWVRHRSTLWNAVEASEGRKDARLAREFELALPHELSLEQNRWLVQDFVRENFTRKGYVADVNIHPAHDEGDGRNIHAHVLVSMRKLEGGSFARLQDRSLNGKAQLGTWRQSWERLVNHHLARHGHTARVDCRSLVAQGIERRPSVHLGKNAAALERKGIRTAKGDYNRQIEAERQRTEIPKTWRKLSGALCRQHQVMPSTAYRPQWKAASRHLTRPRRRQVQEQFRESGKACVAAVPSGMKEDTQQLMPVLWRGSGNRRRALWLWYKRRGLSWAQFVADHGAG